MVNTLRFRLHRYERLGAEGPHSLYRWYRQYEQQHFPDPMVRQEAVRWDPLHVALHGRCSASAQKRTVWCEQFMLGRWHLFGAVVLVPPPGHPCDAAALDAGPVSVRPQGALMGRLAAQAFTSCRTTC